MLRVENARNLLQYVIRQYARHVADMPVKIIPIGYHDSYFNTTALTQKEKDIMETFLTFYSS